MISNALLKLRPNALWEVGEGNTYADIVWKDENETMPTEAEVNAAIIEVQAEIEVNKYKQERYMTYASIQEQLDMQYWDSVNGTSTWKEHIDAVKTAHPKPTE
jgi:hypothetical protein